VNALLRLQEKIDALSQRERILVLLGGVILVSVLWIMLFLDPVNKQLRAAQLAVAKSQGQINQLNLHLAKLEKEMADDVDARRREQLKTLGTQVEQIDQQLRKSLGSLVTPSQMSVILRRLVEDRNPLKLVAIHTRAAAPLLDQGGRSRKEEKDTAALVFKHVMEVELEGAYLDVLAYISALDQLDLNYFWDGLDIETHTYPRNRVRLRIYTLSLDEALIGV